MIPAVNCGYAWTCVRPSSHGRRPVIPIVAIPESTDDTWRRFRRPATSDERETVRAKLHLLLALACVAVATPAKAMVDLARQGDDNRTVHPLPPSHATQSGGMSLSEAVESVRRRGDVERVISAETRVSNGREVHHIRVMTRDGKVKTHKVSGRQIN